MWTHTLQTCTAVQYCHITYEWGLLCRRVTVVGALCKDLCITRLEGKGGESIYHKITLLWLLYVTTYNFDNPLTQEEDCKSSTCFPSTCLSQVLQLGGIPTLVSLLRSPNPGVSQAAAGALRNLVFKHQDNKLEVQHCGGIAKALQLLKETDSTETQKQITGRTFLLGQDLKLLGSICLLNPKHNACNLSYKMKACYGTCRPMMSWKGNL